MCFCSLEEQFEETYTQLVALINVQNTFQGTLTLYVVVITFTLSLEQENV